MTFLGSFIDGAIDKAKSLVTGKDEKEEEGKKEEDKKEEDKKDVVQGSEGAAANASLVVDAFKGDDNNVSYFHDIFFGKTNPDTSNVHDMTLTDNGQPVGKDGKPVLAGGTADKAEQIAVKPTETPKSGDPWDYNSWWSLYETQEKNKAADAAKPKEDPTKATEPSVAEKVANWVGEKWDRWFGSGGKAGSFEAKDDKGNMHSTTMSEKGVEHTSSDGSVAHSDGRGTVEKNGKGDTAYHDNETGATGERLRNGTDIKRNPDGSYTVSKDGKEIHVAADGTVHEEINGKKIEVTKDKVERIVNGWKFRQHRQGDGQTGEQEAEASKPTEDGKPSMTTVEDPKDGTQMIVINDGHGNVVKLRKNGERIMTSTDNPDTEVIASNNSDEVRVRIKGQEYYVKRQEGGDNQDRWYLYDNKEGTGQPTGWIEADGRIFSYDKNDPTKVGEQLGKVQGLTGDGAITNGTAKVGPNGEVIMQGVAANVEINANNGACVTGPDGKVCVGTDGSGKTSQVTRTAPDGKTDTTQVNAGTGAYDVREGVKVDENGVPITNDKGLVDSGTVVNSGEVDAQGNQVVKVNVGDVDGDGVDDFATGRVTPNGMEMELPNGDKFEANGTLRRSNGTTFSPDGTVTFADGTSIDAYGNVKHNGEYVGTAGGYGDGGANAARVNAILAQAASIGNVANLDPGKIGQLMALYSELGAVQGAALAAGDTGAFVTADLAKACVAAAIVSGQNAETRAELTKYFVDHPLSTDQLHQLQTQMTGASPEQVRKFIEDRHWNEEKQPVGAGNR